MSLPKPQSPAKFAAPKAPMGLVLWSPGIGHNWFPAICTQSGAGGVIRVMVFPTESRVAMVKDSVRHKDDPLFPKLLDQAGGIWDFTPEYKLLAKLALFCIDPDGDALPTGVGTALTELTGLDLGYLPPDGSPKSGD